MNDIKQKIRILIIGSDKTNLALKNRFFCQGYKNIEYARNLSELLCIVKKQAIHICIADIQFDNYDGISILKSLNNNSRYIIPNYFLITHLESDDTFYEVEFEEEKYYLKEIGSYEFLFQKINSLCYDWIIMPRIQYPDIDSIISKVFHNLDMPIYYRGCDYLQLAIQLFLVGNFNNMTSIYNEIGKRYNISGLGVNAGIRRVLNSNVIGDENLFHYIFGEQNPNNISPKIFIITISNYISHRHKPIIESVKLNTVSPVATKGS